MFLKLSRAIAAIAIYLMSSYRCSPKEVRRKVTRLLIDAHIRQFRIRC